MEDAESKSRSEPIAIIGLSCRFAGEACNPEGLWKLIAEGRDTWTEIPTSRFNSKGFLHPDPQSLDTRRVLGGHFLEEDIAHFDAAFFNLSSDQAATLDPQFRLQLESVYEALESAGITLSHVAKSKTSVFASVGKQEYRDGIIYDEPYQPEFLETGTGGAFAANRISHFFDLRGESVTIDTGCSSSAVALHQAIQNLRSGQASMSIVGGSNLILSPHTFMTLGVSSRGEGVATLILKRLQDALSAGDPIRAIIRETSLNHNGKSESITSASQPAQAALIRDCYQIAGLDPKDTQYLEANETSAVFGDGKEAGAITDVFEPSRSSDHALRIGCIKSNIGNTGAASGLASVIKVVLAMEKGIMPPSIRFDGANPGVFQVASEVKQWPLGLHGVRRASVNNFGAGGTNAHLVLESADGVVTHSPAPQPTNKYKTKVLVVSAKSEQACNRAITNVRKYLESQKGTDGEEALLENTMYTLGQHRTLFPWVVAHRVPFSQGIDEVIKALESPQFKPAHASQPPRIGMVFSGQGAQWHAMGRELILAYPPFKASLEEGDGYLKNLGADWSLLEELQRDADTTMVHEAARSMPICVALQISLVRLLRVWGVQPTAIASHSSGEMAAAYAVGALSYRSAMAVAYYGALLAADKGGSGSMLALGASLEDAETYLTRLRRGKAKVACINSPVSVTVAGDVSAVEEMEEIAKAEGKFARRLRVGTAFHSHLMERMAEPYLEALINHQLESGDAVDDLDAVFFSSAVTGGRISSTKELAGPEHWVTSLTQPVLFSQAVTDMLLDDYAEPRVDIILELGPHASLGGPIKEIIMSIPELDGMRIPYYSCLVRNTNARDSVQDLVANLLRDGCRIPLGPVNFPWGKWPHIHLVADLPPYPWDHRIRYWRESRANRAVRERSQPANELLGRADPSADPFSPSWRQVVRAAYVSWAADYIVGSRSRYPAAGFICKAIEAAAQLSIADGFPTIILGYRLRDIEIDNQNPLHLPDHDEGVEIHTRLAPVSGTVIDTGSWMRFTIFSVDTTADIKWIQHARGLIAVDFGSANESPKVATVAIEASTLSTRIFDANDLYNALRSIGLKLGPAFRNIKNVTQSSKSKWSETEFESPFSCSHVLHPTALDSVIQAAYTTLSEAQIKQSSLKLPLYISKLWVSNNFPNGPGQRLKAHSSSSRGDAQRVEANILVVDADNHKVLNMEGLVLKSTGKVYVDHETRTSKSWKMDICNTLEWVPDMSLATAADMNNIKDELCGSPDPTEVKISMDLRQVCIYFIHDALVALTGSENEIVHDTNRQYLIWLQQQLQLAKEGMLGPNSARWMLDDDCERSRCVEKVARSSTLGEMVCRLGPRMAAVLRRDRPQSALNSMIDEDILHSKYGDKTDRSFQHVASLLRRLVHKNPHSRILEIGGGQGDQTERALQSLGTAKTGGPMASLYHFTDTSESLFDNVATRFSTWCEIMQYSRLDLENEPDSQGFDVGSYDIVIANHNFNTVDSLADTMANVLKLLKPGGKLLMVATTKDRVDEQIVFGLLPSSSTWSPSLNVSSWDQLLKKSGFTGVDLEVHDCNSEDQYSLSTIMSTAPLLPSSGLASEHIVLITSEKNSPPSSWLESLQRSISTASHSDGLLPITQILESSAKEVFAGRFCVFLGEMSRPFLHDLDAKELQGIKEMLTSCRGLLWVTHGGAIDSENPDRGLAVGLMRSLRNEYVGRKFVTIDLDPKAPVWCQRTISTILSILQADFPSQDVTHASVYDAPPGEFEYAERDGCILIPRLRKHVERNKAILPSRENVSMEPFHQADYPLSLPVDDIPASLNSLAFERDTQFDGGNNASIAASQVQIEPRAYGVSLGKTGERLVAVECAGIISKVGRVAASHGLKEGDRVVCFLQGPVISRVCMEWNNVIHIPAALTFEEAASLTAAFSTAWIGLCNMARLHHDGSVLIHAAAGEVGQAAIMIAQHIGAKIFATVGSSEEGDLIAGRYGIPRDRIFSNQDVSFRHAIFSATDERGVDVVLSSPTADSPSQASFDILAPYGHFVNVLAGDPEYSSSLRMHLVAKPLSFSSVNLSAMMRHRVQDMHRALEEIAHLVMVKAIAPISPITTYPIADAASAFKQLTAEKGPGKVILQVDQNQTVPVRRRHQTIRLSPNASYLLVGGAGGICRSIAAWMIEQGATSLILLSRRAGDDQAIRAFADQTMHETGCRIKTISCDVSNLAELKAALQEFQREQLPPVRGVVQGALVLQDSPFAQMTIDDYKTVIMPKVNGTWNLHSLFPHAEDLEFFIILSSNVGILGSPSQSNYAAGSTYQDALASWRVARGLPCVSIDLPVIKSVGHIAKTPGARDRMSKLGHMSLNEDVVLRLVESAILAPYDGQIVTGINVGPGGHWNSDGPSQLGRDARFGALRYHQQQQKHKVPITGQDDEALPRQLARVSSRHEAEHVVSDAIAQKLADIFTVTVDDIDMATPPGVQGIDSLVAVELCDMLKRQAAAEISSFDIMQSTSLAALAALATSRSEYVKASGVL